MVDKSLVYFGAWVLDRNGEMRKVKREWVRMLGKNPVSNFRERDLLLDGDEEKES